MQVQQQQQHFNNRSPLRSLQSRSVTQRDDLLTTKMASEQHMEEIDEDDTSTSSSDNDDNEDGEVNDNDAAKSAKGDDNDDDNDSDDDDLDDSDNDLEDDSDSDDDSDNDDEKDDDKKEGDEKDDDDDDEDDSDDDDDDDDKDDDENDEDDDDGTSSEPEEEDKAKAALPLTLPPPPADPSAVSRGPAKMRIKLSLRLPTSANKAKISGTTGSTSASPMDTETDALMKPLSLKKKVRIKPPTSGTDDDDDDDKAEAQATVVDSDDAGEEDDAVAVADVVTESTPTTTATSTSTTATSVATTVKAEPVSSSTTATTAPTATKRRAPNPSRQIRFPPIGSPGLLMPVSSTTPREAVTISSNNNNNNNNAGTGAAGEKGPGLMNMNGFITTNSLFQHTVQQAGYTVQNRNERPHRGSSVQRVVGDMFDSNVKLTLHFPELVPKDLMPKVKPEEAAVGVKEDKKDDDDANKDKDDVDVDDANKDKDDEIVKEAKVKEETHVEAEEDDTPSDSKLDLPQLLISKLESAVRKSQADNGVTSNGVLLSENGSNSNSNHSNMNGSPPRKKRRRRPWQFSDMVPVSLTIPYPESYIQKRIEYVKQVEARERAIVAFQQAEEEAYMARFRNETANGTSHAPPSVDSIPPIPEPPTPPRIEEFKGHRDAEFKAKHADHYPYFLPKGKEGFVSHLDKECFHVTEGRYFGLHSNFIADPNFVGPNAPGIAGVNASGGAGLATSTAGGGSNTAGFSLTSLNATYQSANSAAGNHNHPSTGTALKKEVGNASKSVSAKSLEPEKPEGTKSTKNSGPKPTSTSAGLRTIMEKGGTVAEALKMGIIRAAVHASRSGRHGQSFRAPNGETYPDVSKAFAAYAGIKPCERCKNNKQGVSE
jgi:hypothetical protein